MHRERARQGNWISEHRICSQPLNHSYNPNKDYDGTFDDLRFLEDGRVGVALSFHNGGHHGLKHLDNPRKRPVQANAHCILFILMLIHCRSTHVKKWRHNWFAHELSISQFRVVSDASYSFLLMQGGGFRREQFGELQAPLGPRVGVHMYSELTIINTFTNCIDDLH